MKKKAVFQNNTNKGYRYINILTTIIITIFLMDSVVQNYLVLLTPHYYVCPAVFIFPLASVVLDAITEVYGFREAQQILKCALGSWLFCGLFIAIVLRLPYPDFWQTYSVQFQYAMKPYFHNILAIFIAIAVGSYVNILALSKLKILTRGKYFWLRAVSCSFISDLIAISITAMGVFGKGLSERAVFKLVGLEFSTVIAYQIVGAFFVIFIVAFLKKAEQVDIFDTNLKFNPFAKSKKL
ncbi:MAG: VUT family protein [Gammaproteobacteria bacterium]|nr:VUT family protein [Gammaproteobacteria bacterium]